MNYKNTQLKDLNSQMIEVMTELEILIPELTDLENEYNTKYYTLLMQSLERAQASKEASVKLQLRLSEKKGKPSLFEEYSDKKLDVRILLTKKEILFEISRNIRAIR